MDNAPVKIGMKPSHPGEFIREEILNEFGLSVARAAKCWACAAPPCPIL